jgi:hypothetical protein
VYLYAFDVAHEIRLDRAAELLAAPPRPVAPRPDRPAPRTVLTSPPCTFEPASGVRISGLPARVLVRVYDVGVITVTVRVSFERSALAELIPFHAPALDDGRALDVVARHHYAEARNRLAEALVRPGPEVEPEAYTVFCLTHLGGERDANRWLAEHTRAVAGLLTETPGERLSDAQVTDVLRLRRSFENTDLVVIDWDAALVVELNGSAEDVLFVLELANLQLEEFRWMDLALDGYLERAYADLNRRQWWVLGGVAAVLPALRRLRVDLARLADEVTHTTKFVGDWHLARVYLLARERFHLDQWRASVGERLGELDRLYTTARGDLYDRRMLVLEVVIVVLIGIELLPLLFRIF